MDSRGRVVARDERIVLHDLGKELRLVREQISQLGKEISEIARIKEDIRRVVIAAHDKKVGVEWKYIDDIWKMLRELRKTSHRVWVEERYRIRVLRKAIQDVENVLEDLKGQERSNKYQEELEKWRKLGESLSTELSKNSGYFLKELAYIESWFDRTFRAYSQDQREAGSRAAIILTKFFHSDRHYRKEFEGTKEKMVTYWNLVQKAEAMLGRVRSILGEEKSHLEQLVKRAR